MECFAANSPPFCWVDDSRERVRHDVKIRRDSQPVEFDIIAGVDDDGQRGGVENLVKTQKQSRGADTSAKRRNSMARDFLAFDGRHETAAERARMNLTQEVRCPRRSNP